MTSPFDAELAERVRKIGERANAKARGCRCSLIDRDPGCPLHGEDVDQWRELVGQAREAGAAIFVKQLGFCWSGRYHSDLKGGNIGSFPDDLCIRETPAGALVP